MLLVLGPGALKNNASGGESVAREFLLPQPHALGLVAEGRSDLFLCGCSFKVKAESLNIKRGFLSCIGDDSELLLQGERACCGIAEALPSAKY